MPSTTRFGWRCVGASVDPELYAFLQAYRAKYGLMHVAEALRYILAETRRDFERDARRPDSAASPEAK